MQDYQYSHSLVKFVLGVSKLMKDLNKWFVITTISVHSSRANMFTQNSTLHNEYIILFIFPALYNLLAIESTNSLIASLARSSFS